MKENVPGRFTYTVGVFELKGEDPTRVFAGEGDPFRTSRRFKYLLSHSAARSCTTEGYLRLRALVSAVRRRPRPRRESALVISPPA